MTYQGPVVKGRFLSRPNRFIAQVELEGQVHTCHVKNTGRCKELLLPGAAVYLEESGNPTRKTKYDLIAVEKGSLLINMDSQAPNKAAAEYLPTLLRRLTPEEAGAPLTLRPETAYGSSRFDFYAQLGEARWFVEVKGVTLEQDGATLFPDAPTQRGVKHLEELCRCLREGYRACVLFVVQMAGVAYFAPNWQTHPQFGEALQAAAAQGVHLHAVDCLVTPDSLTPRQPVPIRL